MEVKSLDKDTLIVEACCIGGNRSLEKKTDLTEKERTALRAAEIKAEWLKRFIPKGLSAKIAYEGEKALGFIEYMPIELSNFHKGKDLYIINCMVTPHTPPWEASQRQRIVGCGTALVKAMIDDIKGKCKGIVTPLGFAYTEDLRKFFAKFGFEEFENEELKMLIKTFEPVELPFPIRYKRKYTFQQVQGKVVIDIFWSSKCPADPYTLLNLRGVCKELGDNVILTEFCVDDQEALEKYGIESGTYVDGKYPWSTFGPLEKKEIMEILQDTLRRKNSQ